MTDAPPPPKPHDAPAPAAAPETQARRRVKYGLNVAVAAAAAVALVVLLNWIVYRQYVRFDLTATREYSLSEQTRRVLDRLPEGYRVVTLFGDSGVYLQQVRDLIDEYDRYSPAFSAQHLRPGLDAAQRERFDREVLDRFEDQLAPVREAIGVGRAALAAYAEAGDALLEPVAEVRESQALPAGELASFVDSVGTAVAQTVRQAEELDARVGELLDRSLPDFVAVRDALVGQIRQLDAELLAVAVQRFEQAADDPEAPPAVQDALLRFNARAEPLRTRLREAGQALGEAQPAPAYDEARGVLVNQQAVAILAPGGLRVIPASEMYREVDPRIAEQTGRPALNFFGEEKLTGALVSTSLEQPPRVVFVLSGQGAAVGPRGRYEQVAQRLRAVNFEVTQWNPTGQFSQFGQRLPPGPPPEPAPGQRAVWVVLPFPPADPTNPMAAAGQARQQVADLMAQRLEAGDGVLLMLGADPGVRFGQADPLSELASSWGINPQLDRILMRQVQLPDRRSRATAEFRVGSWPEDLVVTRALSGMPGVMLSASPVVLGEAGEGLSVYPLVRLDEPGMWAERDFAGAQDVTQLEPEASERRDEAVVGAAAARADARLIAVAEPVWATDDITGYGLLGPGTAELTGAQFPGNGELFVNSVYWLAQLDELIAASPRAQDIRRIDALSPGVRRGVQWGLLGGLPVAVLATGLLVWQVRRRR